MSRYHVEKMPHSIVFAKTFEDLYKNYRPHFDGMTIGAGKTRHTSLDWFMVPTERPSIEKAEVKEQYVDIPGTNGGLDLTESLTGFPLYNLIEGSFEFNILNDRKLAKLDDYGNLISEKEISWEILNRDIRSFLNGQKGFMMLEDDPAWFYEGRFTVEKYDSSNDSNSKIKINYKVYPFKRLSTMFHNHNARGSLNTYFDTISLCNDDIGAALNSFGNKTGIKLYPDTSVSFSGSADTAQLPCGNENVPVTVYPVRYEDSYTLRASITKNSVTNSTVIKEQSKYILLRDFVLTNNTGKGILYSDNNLNFYCDFPNEFLPTKPYKKDDYVSYISEQSYVTWILKAKENITAGSVGDTIDLTKWEVDEDAMRCTLFSEESSYSKNSLVYILDNNTLTLYKTDESVSPGEFNPSQWFEPINIPSEDLYVGITLHVMYDIGVM